MSQHDYVIANAAGAVFRADINSALAAIVSQNSGTTEPSTTYAYMHWADTTTGLLKIRNASNTGWVTILDLATAQAADSDKLDGMQPATAATASTIAQRDASGDLTAGVFNGTATSARYA